VKQNTKFQSRPSATFTPSFCHGLYGFRFLLSNGLSATMHSTSPDDCYLLPLAATAQNEPPSTFTLVSLSPSVRVFLPPKVSPLPFSLPRPSIVPAWMLASIQGADTIFPCLAVVFICLVRVQFSLGVFLVFRLPFFFPSL